ncbi:hypothetical protein ChUKH1_17050 [Cryptosporidium hominis]|nr:hypothetical protein ChTU502y2012_409g0545 [Cryptosporidium hominis]PPA65441.1 hypothetical protein ChUKH1_17050 [Cryptosporidium hominis]
MNIKIKITFYLLLLIIFGLIVQIQAADGGEGSDFEKNLQKKVTLTQEQTKEALNKLLLFKNELELKCVTSKFLLIFYKYILLLLRFISIFDLREVKENLFKFLGLSELLVLELKTFQFCSLIKLDRLNEILDFVFSNANLNLLKEFEGKSEQGFQPTLKFLISNLQQVIAVLNLLIYHLMNIYVEIDDPVFVLLISFISDYHNTVLNYLKSFAIELSKLKLDEIKEMAKKMDLKSPLFTLEFPDPEQETKERKLLEETRKRKLQVIKRLTESGAKSNEEIVTKSKFDIPNSESLQIEYICLLSLLTLSFAMTNCSFFDDKYKEVIKQTEEVTKKLMKLILNRGTELDLTTEKALSIKLQAYSQLNMDGLRKANAMFRSFSSHAYEDSLINDFEKMLRILSSTIKTLEKKMKRWERDTHVSSLTALLRDFLRVGLGNLELFVSPLRNGEVRFNLKYLSDDDEEQDKGTGSRKSHKKHKAKRENKSQSETVSEREKKISKRDAWLRHLQSRESTMETLRVISPTSSMEVETTKSEDKPTGTKSSRKEEKIKRLLQEEEKSLKREEVKKMIKEQKSSNVSSKRRKQGERKTKNDNRREREERERVEEREKERERERERQKRIEHSNYMYSLLNSVGSIEGMFEEAEKNRYGLGAMISFVLEIITNDDQSGKNVDSLTEEISSLSVSTEDDTGGATSQSRLGSSRRRAYEVPDSGPRRPTSDFFASRVGAPSRRRESSPSGRDGSRRLRQDSIDSPTRGNQGLLTFDGFTTPDPLTIQNKDSPDLKSKFLKFFSSDGENNSVDGLKSEFLVKYCTFSDPSFSHITGNSSTEEINDALESCGMEIQRLHSGVAPTLRGRLLFELKLIEKELIAAFVRMLLLLQERSKES